VTGQDVAAALQIALVFRGRKTRELAKLVGQVRLIEEPTRLRDLRPVDAAGPLGERVEMTETENTAEQLRRQANFSREDREKPSMAQSSGPSHISDRCTRPSRSKSLERELNDRMYSRRGWKQPRERVLKILETGLVRRSPTKAIA